MKVKLSTQDDDILKLQSSIDECVAANLALKEEQNTRRAQAPVHGMSTNMAAPTRKTVDIARRNLITEGLPGGDEGAIYANFLRITSAIKVTIYKSDIEGLSRLLRRDSENKTPGPVLVTMKRAVLRDNILKNKSALMEDPDMSRGGQPVALSHENATEASNCATGGCNKMGLKIIIFKDTF